MADEDEVNADDAISAAADDQTPTSTSLASKSTKKESSTDTIIPLVSHQMMPPLEEKFKAGPVKEVIRNVLTEILTGKTYDSAKAKKWTIDIANKINEKVRELRMKRYKHIVQVIIGELKGAGVKSGVRCLWDSETDAYTSDLFMNDAIFSVVVVFGVYLY